MSDITPWLVGCPICGATPLNFCFDDETLVDGYPHATYTPHQLRTDSAVAWMRQTAGMLTS